MTTAKEINKALIIVHEEMEISELSGEKFILILLKKFSELQKKTNNNNKKHRHTTKQSQKNNANKMRGLIRK